MNPLAALLERLRRGDEAPRLPRTMALGADDFQSRLDEARERLKRDIPPPPDEEWATSQTCCKLRAEVGVRAIFLLP